MTLTVPEVLLVDIIVLHQHGRDTVVTVPRPYATYLVDGKSYKTNDSDNKLSAGEHQLVIRFEGNYSKRDSIDGEWRTTGCLWFKTDGQEQLTFDLPQLRKHRKQIFLKTRNYS